MTQQAMVCTPKSLPRKQWIEAARRAREINPVNDPPIERLAGVMRGFAPTPMRIAVLTSKYWGSSGVKLTVGFLDTPPQELRDHILAHMNAWAETANVTFTFSRAEPQVRIARLGGADGGYWSYVGTDVLSIPANEPTMNLEGFTMEMPESEFVRVVRHETGHTLGCPHEHMRRALVNKINRRKAIAYFGRTQGWTPQEVIRQVLTPIEERALLHTPDPEETSIMCYQIPGSITKNGRPIQGGKDITDMDAAFMATIYPKSRVPSSGAKPRARRGRKQTRPKRRRG